MRARVGRQTVAARAAWDDPADRRRSGPRRLPRAAGRDGADVERAGDAAGLGAGATRRCARCCAAPPSARAALTEAQKRVLEALRPRRRRRPRLPYAALCVGSLGVALAALGCVLRRAPRRPGRHARRDAGAYAYLAPAAVAMLVLVFVPFTVGAGMSLFWHDAGRWTFVGLRNFVDILASRDAPVTDPLSFYFTLAVTALWTVANVALHVDHRRDAGAAPARPVA